MAGSTRKMGRTPADDLRGFSLIELLVVISIVALLIGVLLPALGQARGLGRLAVCLSNQRQYGVAYSGYANDNTDLFPSHEWWYNHAGKTGNLAAFGRAPDGRIDRMGLASDAGSMFPRVLNALLGDAAEVSSCPGDLGDSRWPTVTSCFDAYGTSYQTQWYESGLSNAPFGVVPVNGGANIATGPVRVLDRNRPAARMGSPITFRGKSYDGPWSLKIVQGDFNWHGNRPVSDPRVLWHPTAAKAVRQQNMLFGDGHAEFFSFGPAYGDYFLPVNVSANGFW